MAELKTERPYVVWYKDLEDFVEEKLGIRPDILEAGEWNNDSYTEEDASCVVSNEVGTEWYAFYQKHIKQFLAGRRKNISLEYLMPYLATEGHIPSDKYLIKIWW